MASGNSNSSSSGVGYEQVWRACAGPLLHLPHVGERVFYFPQGHLEQVAASSNWRLSETLPATFDLPSRILCRIVHIDLRATDTGEVYAQITLFPEHCQADVTKPDPVFPDPPEPIVKSFHKVLTATDTSTMLHVRQQDAHECFPPLDMTQETPSQKLVAKDLRGISWNFKHVYGGNPRRHMLSTGWKRFVAAKRLVCGDSVIFLRGENGELRVGTRRVFGQRRYAPHCYLAADKSTDSQAGVLATAHHALCNRSLFIVFYRPSPGISPFIVGLNRSIECATNLCSIGMKFSMRFEREDHLLERCTGSIVEAGDFSLYWKDSQWRCLKVKWDESATIVRTDRISPWEIDPADPNKEQRNQAKKCRQPRHHRSAREKHTGQVAGEVGNMMDLPICPNEQDSRFQLEVLQPSQPQQMQNMSQMAWASCAQSNIPAINPLVSNHQNWIENVGQLNWTSLQTVSQIGQQSNIPMGPLFSNEDNWFQCMMIHEPDQQGSAKDEFGQIFGGAGNNGLNTISCGQFPTDSPPILFSQLDGGLGTTTPPSRVSINSEESVKGDTRKRKTSSVEDAESGNGRELGCDDRQVKCRVEPVSNSNETHYSSASEGEPSTGKLVESTAYVSDRPILYRAMDQIFGFLDQLKNYVAK